MGSGIGNNDDCLGYVASLTGRTVLFNDNLSAYMTRNGAHMTTYSIREFKARVSEILRDLDVGDEVIITRRGKPCGRLTPIECPTEGKPSLSTLKGSLDYLPDATYEDFLDIKALWEPRADASAEAKHSRAG